MALKNSITKAAFDKLSDDVKEHYNESDDGKTYTLDVDGLEDPTELKRAKDRANADNRELRKKLKEVETKLEELDGDDARKSGDIDKITKAAQAKYDKDIGERDEKISALNSKLMKGELDRVANDMAGRIGKTRKAILPHITGKLVAEMSDDGEVTIKVLGDDGKPSTTSLENFEKALVSDKDLADIIVASKASGGGGAARKDPPKNGGAGSFQNSNGQEPKSFIAMSPQEKVAHLKAKKEEAA